MGRKIISKKHRGIRDPVKQQQTRDNKIKNKINNPPKNPELQEGAKVFQHGGLKKVKKKRLKNSNSKELVNTNRFIDKDIGFYPKKGKPFKPIPTIKQNPAESNYKFMKRLQKVTEMVIKESTFEDKYNVDVHRNEKGEVVGVKPWASKEREEKNKKRNLKKKERTLKKKLKKKGHRPVDDCDDGEETIEEREQKLFRKENITFGETVHHPPKLQNEKIEKKVKKVRSDGFLFQQNLKEKTCEENTISESRKQMLEMERLKAVQAYRTLKAQKMGFDGS